MRIEQYPLIQLKQEVKAIVGKYIDLRSHTVFFFGSRVSGKGDARSDIDIGIEGEKPVPAGAMRKMREELHQLPVLYKIELVDFRATSTHFRKVATQHIERIT